jgi:hypothetical protein
VVEAEEEDAVAQADAVRPVDVEGEAVVVPEEVQIPCWSLTDTKEYSSQKEKNTRWSPKTLSRETLSTVRSGYLSMEVWMEQKWNTGYGILSAASWLLVCLAV